jgi:hypothetical protein
MFRAAVYGETPYPLTKHLFQKQDISKLVEIGHFYFGLTLTRVQSASAPLAVSLL